MNESWNRRQVLKQLAATSAAAVLPRRAVAKILHEEPASEREIQITSISEHTVRLSVLPVREGKTGTAPLYGSLPRASWSPHSENCDNKRLHDSKWSRVFTLRNVITRKAQGLNSACQCSGPCPKVDSSVGDWKTFSNLRLRAS
jgi:hypothetical protein